MTDIRDDPYAKMAQEILREAEERAAARLMVAIGEMMRGADALRACGGTGLYPAPQGPFLIKRLDVGDTYADLTIISAGPVSNDALESWSLNHVPLAIVPAWTVKR